MSSEVILALLLLLLLLGLGRQKGLGCDSARHRSSGNGVGNRQLPIAVVLGIWLTTFHSAPENDGA